MPRLSRAPAIHNRIIRDFEIRIRSGKWHTGFRVPTEQELAAEYDLHSVAFCCISTGEFHFPAELAAEIAIGTVREWQQQNPDRIEVIFNVFKDSDYEIYRRLLR